MKEKQRKCQVTNGEMRAKEAPPHEGSGKLIWTEASLWERENMAERSRDVSCAIKMKGSSLLSHRMWNDSFF